jgi:ParB family chromosome partitioning protein
MSIKTAEKPSMSGGLGLSGMGDLSSLLDAPEKSMEPVRLAIGLIDEDPDQPRKADNPGFTKESLEELAETIRRRGVKTPISVRPTDDGRYLVNHGARRLRASKIAGLTEIPAHVDNDYTEDDQVIENHHRASLTPREYADRIGRKVAAGISKKDIAKDLGVSSAFVSQHVALLDLPDPIAKAFNEGRVADVTAINELIKAYKQDAAEVEAWLAIEDQEVTRGAVKLLREFIEQKDGRDPKTIHAFSGKTDTESGDDQGPADIQKEKKQTESDPAKFKKAIVLVQYMGREARLLLNRRPSGEGMGWIKFDDDGEEIEVKLDHVNIADLIEG